MVSTDRRSVRSRSCVQTSDAASGRTGPRANKRRPSRLQRIGVDQARQRSACTFSRGWAGLAGANQRCAAAGDGLVIRRALKPTSSVTCAMPQVKKGAGAFLQGRVAARRVFPGRVAQRTQRAQGPTSHGGSDLHSRAGGRPRFSRDRRCRDNVDSKHSCAALSTRKVWV